MTDENTIVEAETPDAPIPDSSPEPADAVEPKQEEPKAEEPKKNPVQERINQITREKYEERRAREEAEKKARELEERLSQLENKAPPEPREDDYNSTDEYIAAVKSHAKQVALIEARQSSKQDQPKGQDNTQQAIQKVQMAIAKSDIPDLQTLVQDPNLPITEEVIEWLADSDKTDVILFHLANHLDEAYDIVQMTPAQRFRALSKLEATVEKPSPKKVTSAPTPPDPIGNSDGAPINEEKMSVDEWIKRRNAKLYGSN